MRFFLNIFVLFAFFLNNIAPIASAQMVVSSQPSGIIDFSPAYTPVTMKGVSIHRENPFLFDFIIDAGKTGLKVDGAEFKAESQKLLKYFLASLTIKEDDLWVNLSPVEKNRIISGDLEKTGLGRDMLEQDYMLKQISASLIYPEKDMGTAFWKTVYARAQEKFGTTEIPMDTFNKVWIIADKVKVLEHGQTAFVVNAHLKVMLESDYATEMQHNISGFISDDPKENNGVEQELPRQILREIVLPALEKEVNEGRNFSNLRQIFYSMILASWFQRSLKDSLLNQIYGSQGKINGILSDNPGMKEEIYARYLSAYKKGVFDYVREDIVAGQPVPRKYFSGGLPPRMGINQVIEVVNHAPADNVTFDAPEAAVVSVRLDTVHEKSGSDSSMINVVERYLKTLVSAQIIPIFAEDEKEVKKQEDLLRKIDPFLDVVHLSREDLIDPSRLRKKLDMLRRNKLAIFPKSNHSRVVPAVVFVPKFFKFPVGYDADIIQTMKDLFGVAYQEGMSLENFSEEQEKIGDRLDRSRDLLTDLPDIFGENIKMYLSSIMDTGNKSSDDGQKLIFALMQFNNLHTINSIFGTDEGDNVLKIASNMMHIWLHPEDRIARWSGSAYVGLSVHNPQRVVNTFHVLSKFIENLSGDPFFRKTLGNRIYLLDRLRNFIPLVTDNEYGAFLEQIVLQNQGVTLSSLEHEFAGRDLQESFRKALDSVGADFYGTSQHKTGKYVFDHWMITMNSSFVSLENIVKDENVSNLDAVLNGLYNLTAAVMGLPKRSVDSKNVLWGIKLSTRLFEIQEMSGKNKQLMQEVLNRQVLINTSAVSLDKKEEALMDESAGYFLRKLRGIRQNRTSDASMVSLVRRHIESLFNIGVISIFGYDPMLNEDEDVQGYILNKADPFSKVLKLDNETLENEDMLKRLLVTLHENKESATYPWSSNSLSYPIVLMMPEFFRFPVYGDPWIMEDLSLLLGVKCIPGMSIKELEQEQAKLYDMIQSAHDELTGLPRTKSMWMRLILNSTLNAHTQELGPQKVYLTQTLMDIDYFKTINEVFGYALGDEVLIEVAAIMREWIQKGDHMTRWGGEEFVGYFLSPPKRVAQIVDVISENVEVLTGKPQFKETLGNRKFLLDALYDIAPKVAHTFYLSVLLQIVFQNPGVTMDSLQEEFAGGTLRDQFERALNSIGPKIKGTDDYRFGKYIFDRWVLTTSGGIIVWEEVLTKERRVNLTHFISGMFNLSAALVHVSKDTRRAVKSFLVDSFDFIQSFAGKSEEPSKLFVRNHPDLVLHGVPDYPVLSKRIFTTDDENSARSLNERIESNISEGRTGQEDNLLVNKADDAVGGINLKIRNVAMEIARDGDGVKFKVDSEVVERFQKEGFSGIVPVIIGMTTVSSPLPLLGMNTTGN